MNGSRLLNLAAQRIYKISPFTRNLWRQWTEKSSAECFDVTVKFTFDDKCDEFIIHAVIMST